MTTLQGISDKDFRVRGGKVEWLAKRPEPKIEGWPEVDNHNYCECGQEAAIHVFHRTCLICGMYKKGALAKSG